MRIYVRAMLSVVDSYIHISKGAPVPPHRRPAVMARASRYQNDIGPLSYRPRSEIRLTLIRNCLRNCFLQRDLACTVWIHWAAALQRTISTLGIQFSQSLLTCAVGIDWTAGALTGCSCKSLLALAIWVDRTTQLSLHAVLNTHLLELALRLELNVVHVVLFCVEHLNYFFSFFSFSVNIRLNFQLTRVSTTGIDFIRPNPIVFTCFDFRDLQFHTVNIRMNLQVTRVSETCFST